MSTTGFRSGLGFDAHRFADAQHPRPLMLATLQWDGNGIDGESDADIAVHAIIDALLSAAQLGDIGSVFGVGAQSQGAGMSGSDMLTHVMQLLEDQQITVCNIAVTVIGNRPKVNARRQEAQQALSALCGCPVSLLATTTDGMGFTGNGEGIAAIATALIEVPNGYGTAE